MIEIMALALTNKFIEKSVIAKDEKSIYKCGCEIMISEAFFMVLADAVIVVLAPVEDINKKLSASESTRYKKVTKVIILLSSCFIILFLTAMER